MNEHINNFDVHSMIDSSLCLSMNHGQSIDSLSIDWQIWMMRVMIMMTKWWEWFHSSFSFSFTSLWSANRTFFSKIQIHSQFNEMMKECTKMTIAIIGMIISSIAIGKWREGIVRLFRMTTLQHIRSSKEWIFWNPIKMRANRGVGEIERILQWEKWDSNCCGEG